MLDDELIDNSSGVIVQAGFEKDPAPAQRSMEMHISEKQNSPKNASTGKRKQACMRDERQSSQLCTLVMRNTIDL